VGTSINKNKSRRGRCGKFALVGHIRQTCTRLKKVNGEVDDEYETTSHVSDEVLIL